MNKIQFKIGSLLISNCDLHLVNVNPIYYNHYKMNFFVQGTVFMLTNIRYYKIGTVCLTLLNYNGLCYWLTSGVTDAHLWFTEVV
jgi:hypothetical protein